MHDNHPSSWGQYGAHLGPTGPRWATCLPNELCFQGHCDACHWTGHITHNYIRPILKTEHPFAKYPCHCRHPVWMQHIHDMCETVWYTALFKSVCARNAVLPIFKYLYFETHVDIPPNYTYAGCYQKHLHLQIIIIHSEYANTLLCENNQDHLDLDAPLIW